jgi:hypothetical protein
MGRAGLDLVGEGRGGRLSVVLCLFAVLMDCSLRDFYALRAFVLYRLAVIDGLFSEGFFMLWGLLSNGLDWPGLDLTRCEGGDEVGV